MLRVCSNCKIEKPLDSFWRDATKSKGYDYRCKPCKMIERKEYEKTDLYKKAMRKANIKKNYGIDYKVIPDTCQVCGSNKRICVDHDHATGTVRGFLCHSCNFILGHAKDNPATLEKLARYLEENHALCE